MQLPGRVWCPAQNNKLNVSSWPLQIDATQLIEVKEGIRVCIGAEEYGIGVAVITPRNGPIDSIKKAARIRITALVYGYLMADFRTLRWDPAQVILLL